MSQAPQRRDSRGATGRWRAAGRRPPATAARTQTTAAPAVTGIAAIAAITATLGGGLGCVRHTGVWQGAPDPAHAAPDPAPAARGGGGVSLVAVGGSGAPTRWAETVGARLEATLAAEHAAGRTPIVLWLGGLALPRHPDRRRPDCPASLDLASRPGPDAIAGAVKAHVARGHASYATPGMADWGCAAPDAWQQSGPDAGPNPWTMPTRNYVVRIMTDGRSAVVSTCDVAGSACTITPSGNGGDGDVGPRAEVLVELVIVDIAGWVAPDDQGPASPADHADTRQLDALLDALPTGEEAPPRLLVSAIPIEAAGFEGMGGGGTTAAFHYLPARLQRAVAGGVFAGALAAHDRALYATADVSDAVKRSSRAWLAKPVFQVVAGSASLPDARAGAGVRRLRYTRANNGHVEAFSDHAGFAVVQVGRDDIATVLHAHRRRRWETATVRAPLRPPAFGAQTRSPVMTPCQDCREIPANER